MPLAKQNPIPPGTVITTQNWQTYKDYLTLGQQWLFSGQYFWKIQPNQSMVVGAVTDLPLPKIYRENTEKYSSQVTLKELPEGATVLQNYTAGVPFPHPSGPQAAAEILWNVWYRYFPFAEGTGKTYTTLIDEYGNYTYSSIRSVFFRLAHLSDSMQPIYVPGYGNTWDFSEYTEFISPEQSKYVSTLILFYLDPTRPQETWSFSPSLRRVLRLSGVSRCSPSLGTDLDLEDQRFGYNGQTSTFQVKLVGHKKILSMINMDISGIPKADDPAYLTTWQVKQLSWLPPSEGKWEPRESYILEAQKVPSLQPGYCYGLRRLYVDANLWYSSAYELYDMNLKPWKYIQETFGIVKFPEPHVAGTSGGVQEVWDLQNNHQTNILNPFPLTDSQLPADMLSLKRYASPAGLAQVMR